MNTKRTVARIQKQITAMKTVANDMLEKLTALSAETYRDFGLSDLPEIAEVRQAQAKVADLESKIEVGKKTRAALLDKASSTEDAKELAGIKTEIQTTDLDAEVLQNKLRKSRAALDAAFSTARQAVRRSLDETRAAIATLGSDCYAEPIYFQANQDDAKRFGQIFRQLREFSQNMHNESVLTREAIDQRRRRADEATSPGEFLRVIGE